MTALYVLTVVKPCIKCGALERNLHGSCKACQRAISTASRKNNPEKAKAAVAKWNANNAERVKSNHLVYRLQNQEKLRAKSAAYRFQNLDKCKAYDIAYYAANADAKRLKALVYRTNNPEKTKAASTAWSKSNPESIRISSHNRRAVQHKAGGKLSKGLSIKLFKLQQSKCPCCAQELGNGFHMDHIIPLARGGTNTDDNIQLLRQSCNSRKHAKHPIDYMQSKGFLL